MTYTEKKVNPLKVGDEVTHHDLGNDGHPEKWVTGIVTEIGDETFVVQWKDITEDTEYEWQKATIEGNEIKYGGKYDKERRVKMWLWSDAENAIHEAMQKVEEMPADVRLTDAVILLQKAKDRVADFIDGINNQTINTMKKQKLKGEFICLEVRDENNNAVGIDVFYNGVFQHRHMNP